MPVPHAAAAALRAQSNGWHMYEAPEPASEETRIGLPPRGPEGTVPETPLAEVRVRTIPEPPYERLRACTVPEAPYAGMRAPTLPEKTVIERSPFDPEPAPEAEPESGPLDDDFEPDTEPFTPMRAAPPRMVENMPPFVAANSMPRFHWAAPAYVPLGYPLRGVDAIDDDAKLLGRLPAEDQREDREHLLRGGAEHGAIAAAMLFFVVVAVALAFGTELLGYARAVIDAGLGVL